MNRLYPLYVQSCLTAGNVDVLAEAIKIIAVNAGYAFSVTDQFLSDVAVGNRIGLPSAGLTGKTINVPIPGTFDANDLTALTGPVIPPASPIITGLLLYEATGVDGTSRLMAFEDGTIIVTAICAAIITDTSIGVSPLIAALPAGTVMTFSGGAVATMTAPALAGAIAITVAALAAPIAPGETATANTGTGLPLTPSPAGGTIPIIFDSSINRIFHL